MGQKLPENEKELYKRIDEVLHYIWDPIGVSGIPEARDEYNSYLPKILELLKIEDNENEISKYLNNIETEKMGLGSNIGKCNEVAEIIVNWSNSLQCNE